MFIKFWMFAAYTLETFNILKLGVLFNLIKKGRRLNMGKKGKKDKRSKNLKNKLSLQSDWKRKQRSNIKKFVQ